MPRNLFDPPKSAYFDKSRNTIVRIVQKEKVSILVNFVNDDAEDTFTRDECENFINEGIWTELPKQEPKKIETPTVLNNNTIVCSNNTVAKSTEQLTVYVESIKNLKENKETLISLNKKLGWATAELRCAQNKLELDLNELDLTKIQKIMEIIENG